MKQILGPIICCFVFASAICFAIIPTPFTKGNFTTTQTQQINDYYEVETQAISKNISQKAVSIDWFSSTNQMFEKFVDTQIFDIKSQQTFIVQRTGGVGHADIEPINENNCLILKNIIENSKISRRPVLTKINNIWVASSLWAKPHGFHLIPSNNFEGHFCLHFLNSKTDTTKKIDYSHQKTISQALKLSQKYFLTNKQNLIKLIKKIKFNYFLIF